MESRLWQLNGVFVPSGLAEEASPPAHLREQQQGTDAAKRRPLLCQLVHPVQRRADPRTGETHT